MYTPPPLPEGESFLGYARREPGKLRIGRTLANPVEGAEVHPDCVTAYEEASTLLASLGHEVEDVAMPLGPTRCRSSRCCGTRTRRWLRWPRSRRRCCAR